MNHSELLSKIIEAKERIGDDAIPKIVQYYNVENFNEQKKLGCCPFHKEKTPSFIWNPKDQCFSCFGCGRRASLLDMYIETEGNYINAAKKLCEEAGIDIDLERSIPNRKELFASYRFPVAEENEDKSAVYEYLGKRGISRSTIDYMDIEQDSKNNIVFQMHDIDGTLVCKKYRPTHKVKHGSPKYWWDTDSDKCPILYNIDKIDFTKPLLIVEGLIDAVSVIESGYKNVVSIPSGAGDMNWIEFNYEILDDIPEFILWFDNDSAGQNGLKKVVTRLGEYRCKIVKSSSEDENSIEQYYKKYSPNSSIRKTDANNVLLACGQQRVLYLIENAEEIPIENMIDLMSVDEFNIDETYHIPSGFNDLDKQIYGYIDGSLNIWTAYSGCVDCDTEFFNGSEWKKISEWTQDDMVLQYNSDGTTKLVKPLQYHKYQCDNLWHFETCSGIDQCLSDEHTVVYLDDSYNLCTKEFSDVKSIHEDSDTGFSGRFIKTFNYDGTGISLSDEEIELVCDVICGDNFKEDMDLSRSKFNINEKKKLAEIFKKCNMCNHISEENEFSEYWYNCSQHQLQVICQNILSKCKYILHTGSIRGNIFTYSKKTADFIQFAFTACGFSAKVIDGVEEKYFVFGKSRVEYAVSISEEKFSRLSSRHETKAEIEPYKPVDGHKYCFTVPSHMWVMRRNGNIVITGNCGKALTLDSDLLGEHGYFKMGDVKIGDKVYGDDGKLHNVIGVYPQGKISTYKVNFNDGSSVLCSEDHLWAVETIDCINSENGNYISVSHRRVMSLREIMSDEYFKNGELFVPMCEPIHFKDENHPDDVCSEIINYKDKPIPDSYKLSSIKDRINIVYNLFNMFSKYVRLKDGEYSVYKSNSKQHIEDLQFIVNSLGGVLVCSTEEVNGELVYSAYLPLKPLGRIQRKFCSIEYIGEKECQCIMVDNPSHLYLTNNCIVTHNTTLISQSCVLEAIDKGETVFWFNAEITTSQMLNWILSQAAGREHIIEYTSPAGFKYYKPTNEATKAIKMYYANKIFIYDNLLLSSAEDVLEKMKYIYKKRGTKVFVLDNWLCLNFRGKSDAEITGVQVDFMNSLIHFAKKNQLQVHLVAHPRKPQANMPLTEYDILGSSNIVNMADRIFGLEKVWDDDLKARLFDRQFTVFKDRILGVKGNRIGLRYDKATRRLYGDSDDIYKKYSWDDGSIKYVTKSFGPNGQLVGRRRIDGDAIPADTYTQSQDYGEMPF